MVPDLQAILQHDNPWLLAPERLATWFDSHLPAVRYPRLDLVAARKRWREGGRAHLVIGPRQAGKSTAIWTHLAEAGEPALFVDCEQALPREWCRSAPLFLADLEGLLAKPVPLFFEEAQHLTEAGLFLKGLVDRRYAAPILVTGSSSYHLGARTRESLAGRATRVRLLPFCLAEVTADLAGEPELIRAHRTRERLARHLVYGGYPEVWLSEEPHLLLADLIEAVVLRDASDFFRITRPDAFRRLLRLLAGQIGSLVNLSEWAAVLGVDRDTVASYLTILEESHIAVALPPFAGGRRAEITSRPKIYLVDNGLRNHVAMSFLPFDERPDRGPVLENWVFSELWKLLPEGATLHYWRSASGAEVDFVLLRGDDIVAVEVKASRLGRPALPRAARSFTDAYQPRLLLLVNTGLEHRQQLGATEVRWILPAELRGAVQEALG